MLGKKERKEIIKQIESNKNFTDKMLYELSEEAKNDAKIILSIAKKNKFVLLRNFDGLPKEIQNDKRVFIELVKQTPFLMKEINDKLKDDLDVVNTAIKSDGRAIMYAGPKARNNKKIIMHVARDWGDIAVKYASERLKADKDVVMTAAKRNYVALEYADQKLFDDKKFISKLIEVDPQCLTYAGEELQQDKRLVLKALGTPVSEIIRGTIFESKIIRDKFGNDPEVAVKAIKQNPRALEYVNNRFADDRNLVLEAVKKNGYVLRYAGDKLIDDREVVMAAIKEGKSGSALADASKRLQNDRELILEAVKQDAAVLQELNPDLRDDKEVVLTAMSSKMNAPYAYVNLITERLKNDEEVILTAAQKWPFILKELDKNLPNYRKVSRKILKIAKKTADEFRDTKSKYVEDLDRLDLEFKSLNNSRKASGIYDEISDDNKAIYDGIMKKSYTKFFDKLTNEELGVLTKIHALKSKEIIETKDRNSLNEDDMRYMALYTKLSNRYKKVFGEKFNSDDKNVSNVNDELVKEMHDKVTNSHARK